MAAKAAGHAADVPSFGAVWLVISKDLNRFQFLGWMLDYRKSTNKFLGQSVIYGFIPSSSIPESVAGLND